MEQSGRPGTSPIKVRRARKVAALGAVGEHARRWQDLGDALDALVRALAAGDALAVGLSRRVHTLWQEDSDAVLEFHATELRSEARLVLAADVQRGRFILPAYTAGLRLVAIRPQSVAADVMRLASKLGELERGALGTVEFADWLWRGSACGFDIALTSSAAEIGQTLMRHARPLAELWTERSEQAVALWNELAWTAAQSLDAAALAERYRPPLEDLQQRLLHGELVLGLSEAQALRTLADEPIAWARAEIDLLTTQPELTAALPRAHVTFHLLSIIDSSTRFDLGLLEAIAALGGPRQDVEPIDQAALGAALGRMLLVHGFDREELCAVIDRADSALCSGVLLALLEPGADVAHARESLSTLLSHWGATEFFARVSPRQLGSELGTALLGIALRAGTGASQLASVLQLLPIETTVRCACAHPELLRTCGVVIERRIHADPSGSGPLLAEFAQTSPDAARIVGRVVLARQGAGFGPEALKGTLDALVRAGLAAEFVVPLWETRGNASHVRLLALHALDGAKPLLAHALARRVANMLEPPEIREALEELRWRSP